MRGNVDGFLAPACEYLKRYCAWTDDDVEFMVPYYTAFLDALGKGYKIAPSDAIDILWHVHLLDLENYLRFCEERFGVSIFHRLPPVDMDSNEGSAYSGDAEDERAFEKDYGMDLGNARLQNLSGGAKSLAEFVAMPLAATLVSVGNCAPGNPPVTSISVGNCGGGNSRAKK